MAKKRTNAEITAEIAIRKERNDKIVAAARAIAEAEDIAKQEAVDQIDIVPEALEVSVANNWEATRPGGQTAATSSIPSPPNYTPVFDKNKNFIPVVCHCELCKLAHFESVARSSLKAAKAKAAAAWDIARGLDEGDH